MRGKETNASLGCPPKPGDGRVQIETPRDREGSFEPVLIPRSRAQPPKHARRFTGFDDKVIALYARGLTVPEIQDFLLETYGTEGSPSFISTVTDGLQADVVAWQTRPLEPVYPVPHSVGVKHTRMRRWCSSTPCG